MIAKYSWEDRIERARQLASGLAYAKEILSFYAEILQWQQGVFNSLSERSQQRPLSGAFEIDHPILLEHFGWMLHLVRERGSQTLAEQAGEIAAEPGSWRETLTAYWNGASNPEEIFFARACLQPYLELLARERTPPLDSQINAIAAERRATLADRLCPFCGRNPQLAFLGADVSAPGLVEGGMEGGRRFLMCGDCGAVWPFQRIACPSCLEVDPHKLPYYSAQEIPGMRVECCDTCRRYLKSIDMTKDARLVPLVDELAAIQLDLWAREQGYRKIQPNLAGM
ncbi:MAG TPA: formate dehydrogenase accessory protein FdhE [Blastocatellia bacterium]|nr:formate dehydrogenase accessory protein FdhE [Blastocatellia bacterium]